MSGREDQTQALSATGNEILTALDVISNAARERLENDTPVSVATVLANPSNLMVGPARPETNLSNMNTEVRGALARLRREPFIARVDVEWLEGKTGKESYYFCRGSSGGLIAPVAGSKFVSSAAALGHLAECEAGDRTEIVLRNGHVVEGRIVRRTLIRPTRSATRGWDAIVDAFEALPWGDVLEHIRRGSLREYLEQTTGQATAAIEDFVGALEKEIARDATVWERRRREVVERIALHDRPNLDKFQGEVFRLPLDRQVMLFGPPGSGKTTTLIRRLAQKRTVEGLSDREENALSPTMRERLARPNSWAMFSPTELLKQYLGDAFAKAGVPDDGNVRTWEKERHDLARNVLGILRSGTGGRYLLERGSVLQDSTSSGLARFHDELAQYIEKTVLDRCDIALNRALNAEDPEIRREARRLQQALTGGGTFSLQNVLRLFDGVEELQSQIKRLGVEITNSQKDVLNRLFSNNRGLLAELIEALPAIRSVVDDADEEDEDEGDEPRLARQDPRSEALELAGRAIRARARSKAQGRIAVGGQAGRVLSLLGDRLPESSDIETLGRSIATRGALQTLVRAPRTFVLGVPAMYGRFRRQMSRAARLYDHDKLTPDFLGKHRITGDELDTVLLVMLRNVRRILGQGDGHRLEIVTRHDWLESVKQRYLMQVFVDEATDFSSVQLACMAELAYPRLKSWFACGDLRQRVTSNGLRDRSELAWLSRTTDSRIDLREIDIGYRQSERLRKLSDALAELEGEAPSSKAPKGSEEANFAPLLVENLSIGALGSWLADRIGEIETSAAFLPSVAIFVDGDERIDPIVEATRIYLAERSIPIVGCKEGRVVGDEREVRVFDVRHIKGLEFEACFFLNIDELAECLPELFSRIFYVGVTRAATFLGVSCANRLPQRLEPVRSHFVEGGWSSRPD
jgi:hypothetical protein